MDRSELRRLAEQHQDTNIFSGYVIIELLDEIESLKCCWNCANKNNSKHVNTHPECIYRVGKCEKWQGVK
jgi:hypothetical protein